MKNKKYIITIFIIITSVLISGCVKQSYRDTNNQSSEYTSIEGEWFVRYYNVFTGNLSQPIKTNIEIEGNNVTFVNELNKIGKGILIDEYLSGQSYSGRDLKEEGTQHWIPPNKGATNVSGFTAIPGGDRVAEFSGLGKSCVWWIDTDIYGTFVSLRDWDEYVTFYSLPYDSFKKRGYSVRCVED